MTQSLDQAAAAAMQYYNQVAAPPLDPNLAQQFPPSGPIQPPAIAQFFQPQIPPPGPTQADLLAQSNQQILIMLDTLTQAIAQNSTQTANVAQWTEHLIKRCDESDRRVDRAITVANIAAIGLAILTTAAIGLTLWPKSANAAIVSPSGAIVSWESSHHS